MLKCFPKLFFSELKVSFKFRSHFPEKKQKSHYSNHVTGIMTPEFSDCTDI